MKCDISNIHRVKNFVSQNEIEYILNYSKTLPNLQNEKRAMQNADTTLEVFKEYKKKICDLVTYTFGQQVIDVIGPVIRKWNIGEYQDPHSDCEAIFTYSSSGIAEMNPIHNFFSIFIEYGVLLYLNDEYNGGEIYFPEFDLEIKPEKGELIFFPGNNLYMHGVKEVTEGNRFVIQNFLTTPKMQYMLQNFILDEGPLVFMDITAEEAMEKQMVYSRRNIPSIYKELIEHVKRVVQSK